MPPITAPAVTTAQKLPVTVVMFPTRPEGSPQVPDTTSTMHVIPSATGVVSVVSTGTRSFDIVCANAGSVTLNLSGGSSGNQAIVVNVANAPSVPGEFVVTFGEPQPK